MQMSCFREINSLILIRTELLSATKKGKSDEKSASFKNCPVTRKKTDNLNCAFHPFNNAIEHIHAAYGK